MISELLIAYDSMHLAIIRLTNLSQKSIHLSHATPQNALTTETYIFRENFSIVVSKVAFTCDIHDCPYI